MSLSMMSMSSLADTHQQIADAINTYVYQNVPVNDKQNISVKLKKLDTRLNLKLCTTPPQVSLPAGDWFDRNLTLTVSCKQGAFWKLYVPVEISRSAKVIVASKRILRGRAISATDISQVEMKLDLIQHRYLQERSKVVGMVAKKTIAAGTPLHSRLIKPPVLVKRGQRVYIQGSLPGIRIRMTGKAMASGAGGELIQVQNLSSNRIVHAVVIDPNTVEVRL